jgi:hypothetical protein
MEQMLVLMLLVDVGLFVDGIRMLATVSGASRATLAQSQLTEEAQRARLMPDPFRQIQRDLTIIKWMVGYTIVLNAVILWKLFS